MEQLISEAVKWAVPALCAGVAAFAGGAFRALWRRNKALSEGVRSLLRCELVRAHKEFCVRCDPMSLEDLEYVSATYRAYHDLGGNGTGTKLFDEIKSTRIRED